MRIRNLTELYVYSSKTEKQYGEHKKTWNYKGNIFVNAQQDIGELDKTPAGNVDYERIKLRYNYKYSVSLDKNDGISFEKLDLTNKEIPRYIVIAKTQIGDSITCILEINHGN